MKKGFTLAEVLVTLAIIGVVAALTIPVVISNYNKQQWYTRFMKAYNTLSNAINITVSEYGNYGNWHGDEDWTWLDHMNHAFGKYLKVENACDISDTDNYYSNCVSPDAEVKILSNNSGPADFMADSHPNSGNPFEVIYVLQDGTFIGVTPGGAINGFIDFIVDTNGVKKGPNILGRDVFLFVLLRINNTDRLVPFGIYDNTDWVDPPLRTKEEVINGEGDYSCNPNDSASMGLSCGARLLLEGKMNY